MRVVTLLQEKGGTGKTTLSTHIAAGLAIRGARVVLIDADPQGDASSALGFTPEGRLYDLLVRGASWKDVLKPVVTTIYTTEKPAGELLMVIGNVETRNIANTIGDQWLFMRRIKQLEGVVDYVVIDTSPTPSLLHASMTVATDYILVPTQLEVASALRGVPNSLEHTGKVREAVAQHGVQVADIAGIIPTMVQFNTTAHKITYDHLVENYKDVVWTPQRKSIVYSEAAMSNQLMFAYSPLHTVCEDLWAVVDKVERLG
jgi:chromosome partitioning protein